MGANGAQFGKTFFRKSVKKSGMSTFGVKTKVVRSEILHILVGLTARGDLYLIVSWTFEILAQGPIQVRILGPGMGPRDGEGLGGPI